MIENGFIKIKLNGKEREIQHGTMVSELLAKWKVRPELVTVELNETILQKLEYETTRIQEGDNVEFVFYMGGGSAYIAFSGHAPALLRSASLGGVARGLRPCSMALATSNGPLKAMYASWGENSYD